MTKKDFLASKAYAHFRSEQTIQKEQEAFINEQKDIVTEELRSNLQGLVGSYTPEQQRTDSFRKAIKAKLSNLIFSYLYRGKDIYRGKGTHND